ncbi:leucine-rich repeat extensin-like protein 3 [Iris pallida]|uniref:Leucine-rich repeat extensin-like protein 3 n=1 Tax=Iris pallida TaxID=29817 RepID=A0AAX6DRB2_IRIPA|nr:leucine-rich repeat extensin-like protein 3 [Iris pallida]
MLVRWLGFGGKRDGREAASGGLAVTGQVVHWGRLAADLDRDRRRRVERWRGSVPPALNGPSGGRGEQICLRRWEAVRHRQGVAGLRPGMA